MPHLFRPYADTVVRVILIAVVVGPFVAIGVAYACPQRQPAVKNRQSSAFIVRLNKIISQPGSSPAN